MPDMTTAQEAAFRSANEGSLSIESGDVQILVTGVVATLALIWFGWLCVSAYQNLRKPGARVTDSGSNLARGLFVVIVIMAMVTL